MSHHDHPNEPRDREIIVTDGRRGGGAGAVIAAVVGVLVVLLLAFLLFGGFGGEGGDAPAIDVPDEANLDVNVDDGSGEG